MIKINKVLAAIVMACGLAVSVSAQEKIVNPDISYAGTPRTLTVGGLAVKGVEGYEDYVLSLIHI